MMVLVSPSLCTSCQLKDLGILNLYEQLEDCLYEDNSFPLPVKDDIKVLAKHRNIVRHKHRNIYSHIPHHKP